MNESIIKVSAIIENAAKVLKNRELPSHNAFTISEVLGAALALPKEYIMDEMLKVNQG